MDPVGSSGSGGYATAGGVAGGFNFSDEIHCLVNDSALPLTENGNSFSSLLALPPTEALELLNHADCGGEVSAVFKEAQMDQGFLSMNCPSVVFQTNAVGLMDRAARYSVFAGAHGSAEESPDLSSDRSSSGEVFQQISRVKAEAAAESSQPLMRPVQQEGQYGKRKDVPVKTKAKSGVKKSKISLESADQNEKLPYVHVRARRGQATDSHSLAERARREKINIRMKLLQELVPGCSKISGTALVLDEIIKHVQSLQRQVEFLSMRLATVNPRIDFSLDSFFSIGDGDVQYGLSN